MYIYIYINICIYTYIYIEYGADPYAVNQHGQTPFQLIPKDTVRSIKINFQNLFNSASSKLKVFFIFFYYYLVHVLLYLSYFS
jgi:hypothetical protein